MRTIKELRAQLQDLTGKADVETQQAAQEREQSQQFKATDQLNTAQAHLNAASMHDKNIVTFQSQANTVSYELEQLERRVIFLNDFLISFYGFCISKTII